MIVSDEYFVNFIDGTLNSDRKIRIISQGESDRTLADPQLR